MGKQKYQSDTLCEMQNTLLECVPKIGDIKGSTELGKGYRGKFQYISCPRCGIAHWVALATIRDQRCKGLCRSCKSRAVAIANQHRINSVDACLKRSLRMRGQHNHSWKGGRIITHGGYVELYIHEDSPFYSMANKNNKIKEHRLVMAQHLGRCLHKWEVVHHINHIRSDNRIENLYLASDDGHKQISQIEQYCNNLLEENKLLINYINTLGDEILCNAPAVVKKCLLRLRLQQRNYLTPQG